MHRFLQIVITFCTSFFYIYCENLYLNQWAVHVEGGNEVANRLAETHGFENIGQIGSIDDHYLFVHRKLVKRSTSSSPDHHSLLHNDPEVKWVEQQVSRKRVKRDFQETKSSHMSFQDPLWSKQWYFDYVTLLKNYFVCVKS
ncbi:unnamed protein product [Owenia fusiformis]|uniref:Peptidase S8 pro-domain domain-containing protein n=1 Tax=Owenia fusiformis TaxID=6347 RepID=A0A8S4PWA8_OWEFU|nr:unnamed protein product [Owenia fusiformis]